MRVAIVYAAEQFEAMSPDQQLAVANRVEYDRAKKEALIRRCRSADNYARRDYGQG